MSRLLGLCRRSRTPLKPSLPYDRAAEDERSRVPIGLDSFLTPNPQSHRQRVLKYKKSVPQDD